MSGGGKLARAATKFENLNIDELLSGVAKWSKPKYDDTIDLHVRGTKQYAKDIFYRKAGKLGDQPLKLMRDTHGSGPPRVVGARTQDFKTMFRPKPNDSNMIANVEWIEDRVRYNLHVKL